MPHKDATLTARITALNNQIKQTFAKKADYGKIGQTKQKDGESAEDFSVCLEAVFLKHSGIRDNGDENGTYQQHLKTVLINNLQPGLKDWVTKQNVDLPTQAVTQTMYWVKHAETVITSKKEQKKKIAGVFYQDNHDQDCEVHYEGHHGGYRGRGGRQHQKRRDDICWRCGKQGHLARHCTEKIKED